MKRIIFDQNRTRTKIHHRREPVVMVKTEKFYSADFLFVNVCVAWP